MCDLVLQDKLYNNIVFECYCNADNTSISFKTNFWTICYMYIGSCTTCHSGKEQTIPQGCVYVFERGEYTLNCQVSTSGVFEQFLFHIEPSTTLHSMGYMSREDRRFMKSVLGSVAFNESISSLANRCFLSTSTLKRRFTARFNMSPHQWMVRHRLRLACKTITQTRISIGEVAEMFGFDNTSHFIRLFNNVYGMTPRRVRNMLISEHTNKLHSIHELPQECESYIGRENTTDKDWMF